MVEQWTDKTVGTHCNRDWFWNQVKFDGEASASSAEYVGGPEPYTAIALPVGRLYEIIDHHLRGELNGQLAWADRQQAEELRAETRRQQHMFHAYRLQDAQRNPDQEQIDQQRMHDDEEALAHALADVNAITEQMRPYQEQRDHQGRIDAQILAGHEFAQAHQDVDVRMQTGAHVPTNTRFLWPLEDVGRNFNRAPPHLRDPRRQAARLPIPLHVREPGYRAEYIVHNDPGDNGHTSG